MARPAPKRSRTRADDDDSDATDYSSDQPQQQQRKKGKQPAKKGKGKQRAQPESSSDEFDSDASSGDEDDDNAGRKGKQDLTEEEKKFYVQAMVRFVLFNESHRRVLRRQDIVKAVLTDGRGRHFNALLPKVQKILREVLGLDLVTLRQKESASGKPQPKAYIVRSLVPVPLLRHSHSHAYSSLSFATDPSSTTTHGISESSSSSRKTLRSELAAWNADGDAQPDDDDEPGWEQAVMRDVKREEGALYGILGVILALILVNGKVLGDDQLISYLKRLSLKPSSNLPLSLAAPHPDSITLAKFLELLVRQQYLESGSSGNTGGGATQGGGPKTQAQKSGRPSATTQRGGGDKDKVDAGNPAIEWRWGPRSEAELGEVGVAKFVERIFFDPSSVGPAKRANGGTDGDDEAENGGAGREDTQKRKAKTGDKFMNEVARAAGVKQLAGTEGIARGGGGEDDGDEEGE